MIKFIKKLFKHEHDFHFEKYITLTTKSVFPQHGFDLYLERCACGEVQVGFASGYITEVLASFPKQKGIFK